MDTQGTYYHPPSVPPRVPTGETPLNFPPFYRKVAVVFVVLAVALLVLIIYAVMGRASVVVMAKEDSVSGSFIVDVGRGDGVVPGRVLETSETLTRSFPVSEGTSVPAKAVATVRLTSTLGSPQTLVATTRLLSESGVLFRLRDRVVVPPRGSVEAVALADEPGRQGEIGAATFTIPGLTAEMQRYFTVETVEPPTGGETTGGVVAQGDVDAATSVLKEELGKRITGDLRTKAKADGIAATAESVSVSVASAEAKPAVGEAAPSFDLTVVVKVTAVFYDRDALLAAVREEVRRQVPPDRVIRSLDEQGMSVAVEKVDLAGGQAGLRVSVAVKAAVTGSLPSLAKDKLVGVSIDAAKKYLEEVDGIASVSITASPVWARRLPSVPGRISVEVR